MTRTRDRPGPLDVVLAGVCVALGSLLMYVNITDPDPSARADLSWLALPAFLVVTAPVLWRSVAPIPALAVVAVGLLLHGLVFGTIVRCGATFAVVGVLVFAAAARSERRDALVALGLALAAMAVLGPWEAFGYGVLGPLVPLTLVAWGFGRLAHSRGRLAERLRERGQELRVARDQRAQLEVAHDRAQLSGELEGLLERRLGELATLADRGSTVSDPESATELLVAIEHGSRETLDQMRTLVGVLRSDADPASVAPQPTLTSLDALLLRAKGPGAQLTVDGTPRPLPPAVELSAYRVAEQVLHALDDAPGVAVLVRFADDALVLEVTGPARRRIETGAAMQRARERVALHRGSIATVVRDGRAEVTASLPVYVAV